MLLPGIAMNKAHRCLLHVRCIVRKGLRGQGWRWHWEHLLRELGRGIYSHDGTSTGEERKCYI